MVKRMLFFVVTFWVVSIITGCATTGSFASKDESETPTRATARERR